VWTDDFARYPIYEPHTPDQMNPRVATPEEILDHARRSAVNRIVLIQMSYYGYDNSYMLDAMRRYREFAGVALVDWTANHPDRDMLDLARRGVRGFRICAEGQLASCLRSEGAGKMFRCGARERLPICLLILPDDLSAARELCERFSEAPIVIDHLAQAGVDGTVHPGHVQTLCGLAKFPEVKVKVSAFYALGTGRPPHGDLAPLIERVYDAFGPRRLMWGSDWPFQVARDSYEDSISLVRDRLDFLSGEDREWLLRKTAEQMFFAM
jgi:predicted TIM-barrel fold metal-dependent hydrolase